MKRKLGWCLAAATIVILAGCSAAVSREAVDELASLATAERLLVAGSRENLVAVLRAQDGAREAQSKRYLHSHCLARQNRDEWRCRELRGEDPDDGTLDSIEVTGSMISREDLITNNQEGGIDEGDIVKKAGDRLFVLSHARLHVLDIGKGGLRRVQALSLGAEGEDLPWYDELLVAGDRLVILGFDPKLETALLLVFALRDEGVERLAHHEIRVSDYFSDGNYGARIEGENLLMSLSTPLDASLSLWPAWRASGSADWHDLVDPAQVHVPLALDETPTLHAVLRCPLATLDSRLRCEARAVVGSADFTFYATPMAGYLALREWNRAAILDPRFDLQGWHHDEPEEWKTTSIYRFPFQSPGGVQVARVDGWPENQFAMHEDAEGLVVATRRYDESDGALRLLRIAPGQFGEQPADSTAQTLAVLPLADLWATIRFLRGVLWVGSNEDKRTAATLTRQPLDGSAARTLRLPHSIHSIEAAGADTVAWGDSRDEAWALSLITDKDPPRQLDSAPMSGFSPSEDRSHAYNAARIGDGWLFGLPVTEDTVDYRSPEVSDIQFFHAREGRLERLPRVDMQHDIDCGSACDEWYGSARLFFIGERVFAYSGDRMKELRWEARGLREVGDLRLD